MRVMETKVYKFDELSDSAKEKAREWYRGVSEFETEFVYEQAGEVGLIFGLDIYQRVKKDNSGYDPKIYYSGFWSQGDGACFVGTYKYQKGALAKIKKDYPEDVSLHQIVQGLQEVQRKHFYQLRAKCTHRGRYYHSGCMDVDTHYYGDEYRDIGDAEDDVRYWLRQFADWIYSALEKEYDYSVSDEVVDESLVEKEYEFDEDGRRFG